MKDNRKVLWIGGAYEPPPNVLSAVEASWELRVSQKNRKLEDQLRDVPLALVRPNGTAKNLPLLKSLLAELEQTHAIALFLLPDDAHMAREEITGRRGQFLCVSEDAHPKELAAKLATAAALQPTIQNLRLELGAAMAKNNGSERIIEEMDEEMRLAARLQRDFLPRRLPEVGPARFGVLYRPATWVSGDIYDIARLDENHVGFYVADVVGHGMPAALLTMFIKKAIQTKRIVGSSYEIIPPEIALADLNTEICDQNLSSSQFCTAVYCILDSKTLEVTYARGGHPEPILVHRDGQIERLGVKGSLLGIFAEEKFEAARVQMQEGDRLLLYSDGAEEALRTQSMPRGTGLEELIAPWLLRPRDELLMAMAARIDQTQGQNPEDDITIVVLDVEG